MVKAGDRLLVGVNQGDREAMVLAVIGNQALIEYAMPAGSTALQIITDGREQVGRSVSYPSVPTKWLRAIVEAGNEWEGVPQGGKKIPSAEVMLVERTGRPSEPEASLQKRHSICCVGCPDQKPLTADERDGGARFEARQNEGLDY